MSVVAKPRVRLSRKGWFLSIGRWKTGWVDADTGAHIPYVRSDGFEYPPEIDVWVGPFETLTEALGFSPRKSAA